MFELTDPDNHPNQFQPTPKRSLKEGYSRPCCYPARIGAFTFTAD
jgi:hypothetical protein